MKYVAVIEGSGDNLSAFVPDVSGAVGAGRNERDVLESVAQGLAIQLADLQENGLEYGKGIPDPTPIEHIHLEDGEVDREHRLVWVEPAPMNPVSLELERLLRHHHLKQKEVAKQLGVSEPQVSRWLDPFFWGHGTETLRRFADALGLELEVKFRKRRQKRREDHVTA